LRLFSSKWFLKSSLGVNFINVLLEAFTRTDPKRVKTQFSCLYLFALLGSGCVKTLRKMLMKLTPGVDFTNILRTAFMLVDPKSVKRYWQLDWILTLLGATGIKAVRKYVGEIEPCMALTPLHLVYQRRGLKFEPTTSRLWTVFASNLMT